MAVMAVVVAFYLSEQAGRPAPKTLGGWPDGGASGDYVARVYPYGDSRGWPEDGWILDGATCRLTLVVGRQDAPGVQDLDLSQVPDDLNWSNPYEISTRGAFSVLTPDGARVDAEGALYTSTRDLTAAADIDATQDLEIARYPYPTGSRVEGGRTVVSTETLLGVALPWDDGIRGEWRVAVLEVAVEPMDRCDALAPRWERSYGLNVRAAVSVQTPTAPTPRATALPHGHPVRLVAWRQKEQVGQPYQEVDFVLLNRSNQSELQDAHIIIPPCDESLPITASVPKLVLAYPAGYPEPSRISIDGFNDRGIFDGPTDVPNNPLLGGIDYEYLETDNAQNCRNLEGLRIEVQPHSAIDPTLIPPLCPGHTSYDPHGNRCIPNPTHTPGP